MPTSYQPEVGYATHGNITDMNYSNLKNIQLFLAGHVVDSRCRIICESANPKFKASVLWERKQASVVYYSTDTLNIWMNIQVVGTRVVQNLLWLCFSEAGVIYHY